MIDFELPPDVEELRERTAAFIRQTVVAAEDRDHGAHGLDEVLRRELQDAARAAGLFAPHVEEELGGLGLDARGQAVVFEEAGYSILGPQALNCAAPDEGNMHMLSVIAAPAQRDRYLVPLAGGGCPLLLCDDGACAGRRLGSRDAEDSGHAGRRRLVDHGTQVVHHRCRGSRVWDLYGPHLP
jgi:alkylation response protein AidB-like acyl-CoA dehydrogenase